MYAGVGIHEQDSKNRSPHGPLGPTIQLEKIFEINIPASFPLEKGSFTGVSAKTVVDLWTRKPETIMREKSVINYVQEKTNHNNHGVFEPCCRLLIFFSLILCSDFPEALSIYQL